MGKPIPKNDKIHIRDLSLRCIIGINENERIEKQDIIINATLYCDFTEAWRSDSINDSTDYVSIKKDIISLVENSSFFLLEKLIEEIAGVCLKNPKIEKVDISVDKPGALRFARSVAVEITRTREHYE